MLGCIPNGSRPGPLNEQSLRVSGNTHQLGELTHIEDLHMLEALSLCLVNYGGLEVRTRTRSSCLGDECIRRHLLILYSAHGRFSAHVEFHV